MISQRPGDRLGKSDISPVGEVGFVAEHKMGRIAIDEHAARIDHEEMLALGVTVAAGDPHAMRSRVATQAPAPSARVPTEDKVTASRIAEPSHMSSRRSGDNRSHGDTLRAPGVTAGAGTCR